MFSDVFSEKNSLYYLGCKLNINSKRVTKSLAIYHLNFVHFNYAIILVYEVSNG